MPWLGKSFEGMSPRTVIAVESANCLVLDYGSFKTNVALIGVDCFPHQKVSPLDRYWAAQARKKLTRLAKG